MRMEKRKEISMTKKEAVAELEKARVLILTNVERFNEAVRMAHDALKQQAEEEDREAERIESDTNIHNHDRR